MIHYGHGRHQWDLTQRNVDQVSKWLYASSIVYIPTAFAVKTTLLLLIARVFSVRARIARGIHLFIGFIFIAYLPIQICKIFICHPINAYWRYSVQGHCLDQRKLFLADLSVTIFTDLAVLIIPIPLTWTLTMSWKRKMRIVLLLGAGGLATADSILRLYYAVRFLNERDVTHAFAKQSVLT